MPREHERESSDKTFEHESRDDMYWIGAVLNDKRLENILVDENTSSVFVCLWDPARPCGYVRSDVDVHCISMLD